MGVECWYSKALAVFVLRFEIGETDTDALCAK